MIRITVIMNADYFPVDNCVQNSDNGVIIYRNPMMEEVFSLSRICLHSQNISIWEITISIQKMNVGFIN